MSKNVSQLIIPGRACIFFALHPLSYPSVQSSTRYCTALVEDKTVNGNDKDIVIPAGAIDYGMRLNRTCLLTFSGNHNAHMSGEVHWIRKRVYKHFTPLFRGTVPAADGTLSCQCPTRTGGTAKAAEVNTDATNCFTPPWHVLVRRQALSV